MRSTLHVLTILAAGLLVLGGWRIYDDARQEERFIESTQLAKDRIHAEIRLRSALAGVAVSRAGWVQTVDPGWFNPLPRNAWFAAPDQPWIEIAPESEGRRQDPSEISITRQNQATWWFNPQSGSLRARVPELTSGNATRALYDLVNQ
ncbi:MAG: hypothetical protein O3A31_04000 [Planctomycetota bacterium]|jgi:hypothetical protein|nr:hypothetical protein [Planctomycetota bacterium]